MPKREPMSPRALLSANLKALMAANEAKLGTIKKVAEASGLSNGKVGRIYAASHTTDIDALSHLAEAFGLEPWQLMVSGLNPNALPNLSTTPVLEQIRSLVAAQTALPEPDATVPAHQERMSKAAGKGVTRTPTLDRVAVVNHQGGADAERSKNEVVQKQGVGRNAPRASRAGRGR
jgi:hypothetical protein